MWKLHLKLTAGVFLACIVAGVALFTARQQPVAWRPILIVSALSTAVFAVRSFFLLRRARAGALQKQVALRDAMQELVDDVARLSLADLSILTTILERGDREAVCMTSQGSSNHRVFVQMTDLGLMRPLQMDRIGEAPHAFVSVRYALTPSGFASLGSMLEIARRRRRHFASQLA